MSAGCGSRERVAGSSPVGHPLQSSIAKPKTRMWERSRRNDRAHDTSPGLEDLVQEQGSLNPRRLLKPVELRRLARRSSSNPTQIYRAVSGRGSLCSGCVQAESFTWPSPSKAAGSGPSRTGAWRRSDVDKHAVVLDYAGRGEPTREGGACSTRWTRTPWPCCGP